MLNSETKKRIDDCRDILVGKVPDPKSQIEQITIALIYKFMDDMDKEAVELGGERRFFSDGYSKYAWSELFKPEITGDKRVDLYREAIEKMEENPNIPQLFRDIFKNAFLPYRDPETLRQFLKYINEFKYDHSERLGDAFEYLLSVLGSQGEAGQFRTPRHIIDLMVELVNPKKHESILDPACGTAGFLISSYKHILKNNSTNYDPDNDTHAFALHGIKLDELTVNTVKKYKGDQLTPDERIRLINNIKGYDISPDMVRLSLVNLYLHGFSDPHIFEYDTLTSEERWNEYYDVIMANPPFMSPKGGIRPHKRFGVASNRSEVLFVDYIAEHLTVHGRAAVIVPEGIIFQSGTAYKKLRKMLVDDGFLLGVISLPAGMFNPYSGVKTSILWLDKQRAKRTDKILFVKIANDGFDLGAQRRPIKLNDLPEAFKGMMAYKLALDRGEHFDTEGYAHLNLVDKSRIAENGDYNLSGERYVLAQVTNSEFDQAEIGNLCELIGGGTPSKHIKEYWQNGTIKWISSKYINDQGNITGYDLITDDALKSSSSKIAPTQSTIIITRVSVGKTAYADDDYAINQDLTALVPKDSKQLNNRFLFIISNNIGAIVEQNAEGLGVKGITRSFLSKIKIPLPPLSVQEEIVAEIDSYQKIIDGARQVVDNYKPRIDIDPDWPLVELGEVSEKVQYGLSQKLNTSKNGYKTFRMNELVNGFAVDDGSMKYTDISDGEFQKYKLNKKDILFNRTNSFEHVGRTGLFYLDGDYCFASYLIRLTIKKSVNAFYLNYYMNTEQFQVGIKQFASRAIGQANINAKSLQAYRIPMPDLEIQKQIVFQIEREQELVKANKELISIYEQKIKDRIARIWGD